MISKTTHQNFAFKFLVSKASRRILLLLFLCITNIALSQIGSQSPSIDSGVTFQWEDTQNGNNDNPATIESITINGEVYPTFAVPSGYQLTRLGRGPGNHSENHVMLNGTQTIGTSATATMDITDSTPWDDEAKAAFQSKNLNYYFESNPTGRSICLDFDKANGINGEQETDSQMQTLFYNPPIPSNDGGILAVTERGGNNCLYVRFFGIPAGGGPEQPLGDTFVRTSGNLTGGGFSAPASGSDYWGSGREQDNGQTIAIGLFHLNSVAPTGSLITKVRFLAASNDHGDGKVFILQKYAVDQTGMGCVDEPINGNLNDGNNVPANSTYTLSGPPPAGQSFTLNTDGTYTYVPNPGFTGTVAFDYEVCLPAPNQAICGTATVTLTVNPNPDEATAEFTCGNTPNSGVLNITAPTGGQYKYALDNGNFQSSTQFNNIGAGTYIIKVKNTNTNCISEVSYIVEDDDNDAPVAFGEEFSTGINQSITFNVLDDNGNGVDFDPDGDPFTIISNTQPGNGSIVNNGNGSFTFTPSTGFVGSTFFTYTIEDDPFPCENLEETDTATVTIQVVSDPEPRDCNCSPLYKNSNFVNPQLISGQALEVGAVYRFADVFPSNPHGTTLDALVRIEEFAGGASLLEIDVTSSGLPEAFQPRINSTNNNDQSVLFSITFVESGGNYGNEVEISFYGTPLDIDGDNVSTREYAELSLPDAYFVSNNTFLDITQTATEIRGESTTINVAPGDDVSLDPRYTYSNYWQTKSSLTYRIGKLDGNSDRYYSFNVSCADYDDPDAVFITNPVICGNVSDEQGNPLANVTIDITGSDGSSETVTTDANGDYKKEVVIPDPLSEVVFEIVENDLPGYISISDVDGANDNLITRTISLESSCGNDFVDGFEVVLELDNKTDILCNGDNTGSITVTASGGVPPYTYTLNGGTPQASATFDNLVAGNYTIEVTDSLGNTDSLVVNLTQPEPINIEITKTNAAATSLCNNGTATATASGGVGPYTYQWNDPNNQTTATATGLYGDPIGGTQYTVTITDENGCTSQQSVVINCVQDCDAVISVDDITDVLCKGDDTGSATVSASSQANPNATFTFTWNTVPPQVDTGVTSSTLSDLTTGVYTVSVTIDGTLCAPVEESITINEPSTAVSVTATSTDESGPTTGDGTATANPSGGTPPYTYSWSPGGEITQTITGLSAGDYTVTVTDANGCMATATTTVNPGTCQNLAIQASSTPVTCNGDADGTATANVTGGSGNFSYAWSPGGETTQSISNLTAGTYTVTVTDNVTLCTATASTTVNQPAALSTGIAVTDVSCFGENTGSLDLTVNGGTQPYTFAWSNGATTEDITNLPAGTYSVTVTDANGCTISDSATIDQPAEAVALQITTQTDIVCTGLGSVTVDASGGTAPYAYSLDGGTAQASGTFDNLDAGTYTISVSDANLCTESIQVTILENCTDAIPDINDTPIDTAVSGNVLTNDEDYEGDNQTVTTTGTFTTAQGGTVQINADGSYTYTPPAGFVGEDTFDYSIEDDGNPQATDSTTVTIEVISVQNNSTIANNDTASTEINTNVQGNVLVNDFDPENDTITVTTTGSITTDQGGTIVFNADGSFDYTPPTDFVGEDTVTYSITDDNTNPATDSAVLTITVLDDPAENYTFANDDAYFGNAGATINGNVLDNDSDPEGDIQAVNTTPVTGPTNGTVTLNSDGTFEYVPNDPAFQGTDSFVYSVCDNGTPQACDEATVYITLFNENTTDAIDDINDTLVDMDVSGNVLTNDEDLQGDNQVVTTTGTITTAQGGSVVLNADGSYTYSPPAGFTGTDTFEYSIEDDGNPVATDTATVTIEVRDGNGGNTTIANNDTATTSVGEPVDGNVLVNDIDLEGDAQVVTTVGTFTTDQGGSITIDSDGNFTYTPPAGFTGEDTFTYSIEDNGTPVATDDAVLTITVNPVGLPNTTDANDDAYSGNQGATITGNVLDNDNDQQGDLQQVDTAVTPVSGPSNGTLTINADGTFTYVPNDPNFQGTDQFVYEIFDDGTPEARDQATVLITIFGQNTTDAIDDINDTLVDVPVAGNVLTNDEDAQGDAQTVTTTGTYATVEGGSVTMAADGSYTYTPPAGFTGTDSFEYTIVDDGNPQATDTATVTIEVRDGNGDNTTIANNDIAGTEVDTPVDGNVLVNDIDLEGDAQQVTTVGTFTTDQGGNITIDADGNFTYTPPAGFTGEDTFTYSIVDDNANPATDSAVLTITVDGNPGNNQTYANDDAYAGNAGGTITGNVSDNDSDPEGDTQTVNTTPVSGPSNGTVTLNPDGSFSYVPNDPTYQGPDQFVYEVCDDGTPQACDQATVYITIFGENTTDAIDDINDTLVDMDVSGNVLTNDEDLQGDNQVVTTTGTITTAQGGSVVLNADGSYTYSPPAGFTGTDTFEYSIEDDGNPVATDTATVTIEVRDGNGGNTTIANNDTATTSVGEPVDGNVLVNDIDLEGDAQVVTTVGTFTTDQGGSITIDSDGNFTYTPPAGFTGEDTFTYSIEDNGAPVATDDAVLTITVNPVGLPNTTDANDDAYSGNQGATITGNVLDNDNDQQGDLQQVDTAVTPVSGPSNGTLTINADGTFTYVPNDPNFQGTDQFVYEIFDDGTPEARDQATVLITIFGQNTTDA
ncbi:Ig-like domain-containing protein, partial [Marinirhabdus gelatinilytica]|uniref:Ig-like domain-containing protein n=1 Tax=Marinirhabdus gelatinilytica TaxID=1703343 RepID=UPI000E0E1130